MLVNLRLNLSGSARGSNFKFYIKTSLPRGKFNKPSKFERLEKLGFKSGAGSRLNLFKKKDEISLGYSSVDFLFLRFVFG